MARLSIFGNECALTRARYAVKNIGISQKINVSAQQYDVRYVLIFLNDNANIVWGIG